MGVVVVGGGRLLGWPPDNLHTGIRRSSVRENCRHVMEPDELCKITKPVCRDAKSPSHIHAHPPSLSPASSKR